jgi:hypothetical protein
MKRKWQILALAVLAAVAGAWVHRTMRTAEEKVAVAPPPAPVDEKADRDRSHAILLTAGEQALAKGQIEAASLAVQSVPEDTAHSARRTSLQVEIARQRIERKLSRERDAGVPAVQP